MPQGKLADAQHTLANEYGFSTWRTQIPRPCFAESGQGLEAAVRDMDAARVDNILKRHPELQANTDYSSPHYGFGIHALYAAVYGSDRDHRNTPARGRHRPPESAQPSGVVCGFGVLDERDPGLLDSTERGALLDGALSVASVLIQAARAGWC